jgi:hypothetical protein
MLRWYGVIFKRVSGKRTDCDCPSVACRLESCTGMISCFKRGFKHGIMFQTWLQPIQKLET